METSIMGYIGIIGTILGLYRDDGQEKMETPIFGCIGIIGTILGFYGDNGKENGNYYNGLCRGYMGDI